MPAGARPPPRRVSDTPEDVSFRRLTAGKRRQAHDGLSTLENTEVSQRKKKKHAIIGSAQYSVMEAAYGKSPHSLLRLIIFSANDNDCQQGAGQADTSTGGSAAAVNPDSMRTEGQVGWWKGELGCGMGGLYLSGVGMGVEDLTQDLSPAPNSRDLLRLITQLRDCSDVKGSNWGGQPPPLQAM